MSLTQYINFKKAAYHFFAWLLFYYFWYRYFIVSSTHVLANLLALFTTIFSALTFYITLYNFIPLFNKIKKRILFVVITIIFIAALSFLRTISVAVVDRLFASKVVMLHFMGEFFTSVFHTSYAFVFAIALSLYAEKHKQQLRLEKELKERLASELEFLKNQINPHFLFNIHNSIYFLIKENPDAAEKTILMLSEIMRYQLYECNQQLVSLQKELHNISNYIELEKMRAGNKIKIEYNNDVIDTNFKIAPFALLTLVENAFKHVSAFPDKPNFINISSKVIDNYFYFSVINSVEEDNRQGKNIMYGIGLKNLMRRLELMYDRRFDLFLLNKENIFSSSLKLLCL